MVYTINLQEKALSSKERNKLDDSEFGIPKERKYPLNDEAHVRAAVKFFNKVEPKYEESLARRIIKRIKELNLDIQVGEDNKLSKYYKSPKKESTILVESYKNPIIIRENTESKELRSQYNALDKRRQKLEDLIKLGIDKNNPQHISAEKELENIHNQQQVIANKLNKLWNQGRF